jgi:hypothetical protein
MREGACALKRDEECNKKEGFCYTLFCVSEGFWVSSSKSYVCRNR